jgi:hypothetical protein
MMSLVGALEQSFVGVEIEEHSLDRLVATALPMVNSLEFWSIDICM